MPVGLAGRVLLQTALSLLPEPTGVVLRDFLDSDPDVFMRRLRDRRSPPITEEIKRRAIMAMPVEGRIPHLSVPARMKLDSLKVVLQYHQRDSVYELMVYSAPQGFTGLYARSVILLTEPAINLLDTPELQATVAHEAAHEYFWNEYQEARKAINMVRLQELELYCDGVAIITMNRLGLNPASLMTGIEKIIERNKRRLGEARNEDRYPALADRKRFAKALIEWAASR